MRLDSTPTRVNQSFAMIVTFAQPGAAERAMYFGMSPLSDQPVAVEPALYWDANGQLWAAGTNATATPLP